VLLLSDVALGQSGDGHHVSWGTVDGGSNTLCVGSGSGIEYLYRVFLPLILKNYGL